MITGAILLVDTKGIIVHWSNDAEEIFGYGTDEVAGK
ncbi:MAG TPA: PAS domain S-box protein [Sneathiellales bacterium]|jgi:PAS domain S-box-containing protein|nr:PAS domain S-box protein [Sneathiellales bacterium]